MMFAQLEFDPVSRQTTVLRIYRNKKDAADRQCPNYLLSFELTNEQLSELVVRNKIKVVNTDEE